jgi:hypothetical protein
MKYNIPKDVTKSRLIDYLETSFSYPCLYLSVTISITLYNHL